MAQVHKGKFNGLDFDRQKIIGNYIVDFYCANVNVVVEIDGSSHDNKQAYDAKRDAYLQGLGLTVIHITDTQVKDNLANTIADLKAHPAFQAPLPGRGSTGYKSSGGTFVDSELGRIPEGWEVKRLNEISENHNKKRKPISTRERSKIQGDFPYYGATKVLDYINEYRFDGEFILLAEDGTVKTERDTPYLQYIEGQFWVSNHAHVLSGNSEYSNEFLYLCLSNTNVIPIITGAVQLKVNKQNLESLTFITPPNDKLLEFERKIIPLFKQQKANINESQTLTTLRDTLLPKLISGEVRVKEAQQIIANAL